MPEQDPKLTRDELEELSGEELPDRVAMSLIANLAAPAGAAVAADAIADPQAAAGMEGGQVGDVDQPG
jgi:hypothetical protein